MATQTQTQRKATAQKAAATRRRNAAKRSQSARKAAETRAKAELNTAKVVQAQAERAVLIPVGAALIARDAVIEAAKPYTAGRDSAERELGKVGKQVQTNLRKFERRGTTARNRAVREVKKTRTRVERELRQRRGSAVRQVKSTGRERAGWRRYRGRAGRLPRVVARLTLPPARCGESGSGERLPATYSRRQCAVSLLPQPAPSLRGRRWCVRGRHRRLACDNGADAYP